MRQYSPYAGRSYPSQVLWGDQHLRTGVSVDSGTMCTLEQAEAFRFARGEEVTSTNGLRVKLARPLDLLVIKAHAEVYGLMPQPGVGARIGTDRQARTPTSSVPGRNGARSAKPEHPVPRGDRLR